MSWKTSVFIISVLLLLLNDTRAGKHDNHRKKHHHHDFHYDDHDSHHDEDDYDEYGTFRDSNAYFHQLDYVSPQRPRGPPGHHPHDFIPPGQMKKLEGFVPPGQRKKGPPHKPGGPPFGPPCSTQPPSFQDTNTRPPPIQNIFTQPPSFVDVGKPSGSTQNIDRDFIFPTPDENSNKPNRHPYDIAGYTQDEFPVILLPKSDIRK